MEEVIVGQVLRQRRGFTTPVAGVLLLAVLGLGGCGLGVDLSPPSQEEIYVTLRAVLCEGRGPTAELPLAAPEQPPEGLVTYRPADDKERAALFLPAPMQDIEIVQLRSRVYPVWRILLYGLKNGERVAPFLADVVPVEGRLMVLIHWRPGLKLPHGEVAPDFRPHPGEGPDRAGRVAVVIMPPWAITPH